MQYINMHRIHIELHFLQFSLLKKIFRSKFEFSGNFSENFSTNFSDFLGIKSEINHFASGWSNMAGIFDKIANFGLKCQSGRCWANYFGHNAIVGKKEKYWVKKPDAKVPDISIWAKMVINWPVLSQFRFLTISIW